MNYVEITLLVLISILYISDILSIVGEKRSNIGISGAALIVLLWQYVLILSIFLLVFTVIFLYMKDA